MKASYQSCCRVLRACRASHPWPCRHACPSTGQRQVDCRFVKQRKAAQAGVWSSLPSEAYVITLVTAIGIAAIMLLWNVFEVHALKDDFKEFKMDFKEYKMDSKRADDKIADKVEDIRVLLAGSKLEKKV
eukprot:TRINITY_DN7743_c0_g1_i2.p3 TRINITY_DN7743_c0_g1~~TRINITY_DN7743_c0_g1_i2.p3  ORF type:complete len:130 (+),score=15.08 TRINITY_DN7743_c0_g1_i2:90-479(+)